MHAIKHEDADNQLFTVTPPDAESLARLRGEVHGRDQDGQAITIGDLIDQGHAVPMGNEWLMGDELLIDDDGLKLVPVSELDVTSGIDGTGDNDVRWLEARKSGKLVKRSINPVLKGVSVEAPPQAVQALQTSRGIMLSSDLERRCPIPGRVEYWFKVPATERSDAEHAELAEKRPDMYETRTGSNGAVENMELVHASAIAAKKG